MSKTYSNLVRCPFCHELHEDTGLSYKGAVLISCPRVPDAKVHVFPQAEANVSPGDILGAVPGGDLMTRKERLRKAYESLPVSRVGESLHDIYYPENREFAPVEEEASLMFSLMLVLLAVVLLSVGLYGAGFSPLADF